MNILKKSPLGGWLFIAAFALGGFTIVLLFNLNLLWHGVAAQGVITDVATVNCGGRSGQMWQEFSVRFTDRAGQVLTSTVSQCDYSGFNASPGESVAIVFLPDDPTVIAPPDQLINLDKGLLIAIILSGLITLILLPLWIRKRIRKPSS